MTPYHDDISPALKTLRSGGIILYPTDTIWGIGCDATNPKAVQAVYRLKKRDESKSMLVLVDSVEMLEDYCRDVPEVAIQLSELSEKPCTLVLDGAEGLAPNLIASDGSVGMRVSRDPFSRDLIKAFGKPIVSTSANISGEPSPAVFNEISEEVKTAVDYIVNWRRDDNAPARPSSVIKIAPDGQFKIIRQ